MNSTFTPKYVNLKQVKEISRGNPEKFENYLKQFTTLIPERIERVKLGMKNKDRTNVRKVIHNMSPQIQFFGIPEIEKYITRLEFEYQTMPIEEIENIVTKITNQLKMALEEVRILLEQP